MSATNLDLIPTIDLSARVTSLLIYAADAASDLVLADSFVRAESQSLIRVSSECHSISGARKSLHNLNCTREEHSARLLATDSACLPELEFHFDVCGTAHVISEVF